MYLLHACSPSATYTDFFPVGLHFTLATHQRSNGPRECHVNHVTLNALNQSNLPVGRDDEAIIEESPTHKVYRVTIQLVQNLPLTLIGKLRFGIRSLY